MKKIAAMHDVVKSYGTHTVLDHISLDIREGEIVGLLGPNGAGKTTFIQTLTGMTKFDGGRVELFGDSNKPFSNANKEKIGLVPQEVAVFEELTAKECLLFFAGVYGLKGSEKEKRVTEALKFVGLEEQAHKVPYKFSGGMKRRLNIACALMHRPKFLIMDEPTVGIDPQSRNHILESVRKLRENGTTILYTTHYMEEVQAIASRVVIMDQGRIISEGTVDELVEMTANEEKVNLDVVNAGNIPISQLKALPGVTEVNVNGNRITIVSATGSQNLDGLLSLVKQHTGVVGVQSDRPNLEDVFLTLTGRSLRDGEGE